MPPSVALILAVLAAGTAAAAQTGTGPPAQVLNEPRRLEAIPPAALTREVLGNIRLEGWRDMGGFILRLRRLELAVAWDGGGIGGAAPFQRLDTDGERVLSTVIDLCAVIDPSGAFRAVVTLCGASGIGAAEIS